MDDLYLFNRRIFFSKATDEVKPYIKVNATEGDFQFRQNGNDWAKVMTGVLELQKGIGGNLIEKLETKAKESGFSSVFTRTHNERLSSYYIKSRKAKVLKRLPMASYVLLVLKWEI